MAPAPLSLAAQLLASCLLALWLPRASGFGSLQYLRSGHGASTTIMPPSQGTHSGGGTQTLGTYQNPDPITPAADGTLLSYKGGELRVRDTGNGGGLTIDSVARAPPPPPPPPPPPSPAPPPPFARFSGGKCTGCVG